MAALVRVCSRRSVVISSALNSETNSIDLWPPWAGPTVQPPALGSWSNRCATKESVFEGVRSPQIIWQERALRRLPGVRQCLGLGELPGRHQTRKTLQSLHAAGVAAFRTECVPHISCCVVEWNTLALFVEK